VLLEKVESAEAKMKSHTNHNHNHDTSAVSALGNHEASVLLEEDNHENHEASMLLEEEDAIESLQGQLKDVRKSFQNLQEAVDSFNVEEARHAETSEDRAARLSQVKHDAVHAAKNTVLMELGEKKTSSTDRAAVYKRLHRAGHAGVDLSNPEHVALYTPAGAQHRKFNNLCFVRPECGDSMDAAHVCGSFNEYNTCAGYVVDDDVSLAAAEELLAGTCTRPCEWGNQHTRKSLVTAHAAPEGCCRPAGDFRQHFSDVTKLIPISTWEACRHLDGPQFKMGCSSRPDCQWTVEHCDAPFPSMPRYERFAERLIEETIEEADNVHVNQKRTDETADVDDVLPSSILAEVQEQSTNPGLTKEEVKQLLSTKEITMTDADFDELFASADSDNDGFASVEAVGPKIAQLIVDPAEEAIEKSDEEQSAASLKQMKAVEQNLLHSNSATNLEADSRVGDTSSMREELPVSAGESAEMFANFTTAEQEAINADQASKTFVSDDSKCTKLLAEFNAIKQLIASASSPEFRNIEQNGFQEDLKTRHADLVKCGMKSEGSLNEELEDLRQLRESVSSDMHLRTNFIQLGYTEEYTTEGSGRAAVATGDITDGAIVSSSAQLDNDFDKELDDEIRELKHTVLNGEGKNTTKTPSVVDVHIDTTSASNVPPLHTPNEEIEQLDDAVLDAMADSAQVYVDTREEAQMAQNSQLKSNE